MSTFLWAYGYDNIDCFVKDVNSRIGWVLPGSGGCVAKSIIQFQWVSESNTGIALYKVVESELD